MKDGGFVGKSLPLMIEVAGSSPAWVVTGEVCVWSLVGRGTRKDL